MRATIRFSVVILVVPTLLSAQRSVGERLRASGTRTVAFSAHTRSDVCGDGVSSYSDGLSGPRTRVYDGMLLTHAPWDTRIAPCERGPMRVTVRMVEGVPSWLRTAVGPLPVLGDTVLDLGMVSTADAGEFLQTLARSGEGRASESAMMPLILLDSIQRWQILAAAGRDTTRLLRYRRRAGDLLARAAAFTLGHDASDDDDASGIRREAVYAIARKNERSEDPVPQLIDIAVHNAHRDVRVAALYQLGQLGDPRAIELFSSMLRGKL